MKVLLVNGSPNEKGCTYTALREVARELDRQEIATEVFQLGKAGREAGIALPETEERVWTNFIR